MIRKQTDKREVTETKSELVKRLQQQADKISKRHRKQREAASRERGNTKQG
jgi:sensor histidine kinase YesM